MRDHESVRGRHPHQVLTTRAVQARHAPGRIADGNGLYLLVGPTGSKSWVLRTVVHGTRRDIGLGSVRLISLAEAREEAQRLRKIARNEGDPLLERRRRNVPTFEAAARLVHAAHAASFKNIKHRKEWLASLGAAFAAWGTQRVDAVTSADILGVVSPRWHTQHETASRILQRIRVIFEWCKAQGYRTGDNPTDGLTTILGKYRGKSTHRPSLPYQEVPAFLAALHECEAGEVVQLALEFLILSGTRTVETQGARWLEVDLDAKTWTIPGIRMKGGLEHRVPLSPRCFKILERAKALSDEGPYVFPGRHVGKPLSNMAMLMTTRRMTQQQVFVPSRSYVPHGFRSSFRVWAEERTRSSHEVKEAALAHKVGNKTEAAYNRSDLFDQRRELMTTWAAFATAKPAKVVPIRA